MTKSDELSINIFISKQALERIKKDRFLKQNRNWYVRQINNLHDSNLNRPTERIGDFNITPRGHEKRRIAWHFTAEKNIINLFIDDLLYHITDRNYVDNWNIKAEARKISLRDYGPYLPFEGL